jgi:hypothetical protein
MRGKIKNIVWLSLTLVMLLAMLPGIVMSPTTRIYCDPSMISGILPNDPYPYFDLEVRVTDVTDLWAAGFTVDYRPFVKAIVAIEVTQGDFLEDSYQTEFNSAIDTIAGEVVVGYSRLPVANTFPFGPLPPVGVDGSGLLATIKFKVISAGESPINLVGTALSDRNGAEINHHTSGGYFYGPTVNLIRGHVTRRDMMVGETQYFYTKVKNTAKIPMEVRAHWDIYRVEDLQRVEVYSGQTFAGDAGLPTYLYAYVDGYTTTTPDGVWEIDWATSGWDVAGGPEALIGLPDGVYIESLNDADEGGFWTFEDVNLQGRAVGDVDLEAYSRSEIPANDIDSEVFAYDEFGDPYVEWAWGNSQGGSSDWEWTNKHYYLGQYDFPEYYGYPLTSQAINSTMIALWNYGGGSQQVDAYRLVIEVSKFLPVSPETYVVQPNEALELPECSWTLKAGDTGKWITTLSCDYRFTWSDEDGYHTTAWIPSEKVKTLTWWVMP